MNRTIIIALFVGLLASCQPTEEQLAQPENILQNLPISDRDLLLAPLESAYDDLRDIAENDPGLAEASADFDGAGTIISESYKMRDADTVAKYQVIERQTRMEKRAWFSDDKAILYFSTARIKSLDVDGEKLEVRDYKFYFEDDGSLLSGYGKTAYNGDKLPSVWTPICLTTEQERYLFGF